MKRRYRVLLVFLVLHLFAQQSHADFTKKWSFLNIGIEANYGGPWVGDRSDSGHEFFSYVYYLDRVFTDVVFGPTRRLGE